MAYSNIILASCAAAALMLTCCSKDKAPDADAPQTLASDANATDSEPAIATEQTALESDSGAEPIAVSLEAPAKPEDAVVETPKGPMKVMVVMDSSGSMWGQIDGKSKRDIAREAVRTMVASNPDIGSAGLIAYGHRRKGDCKDIELLRSPGATTPLPDVVDRLVPVGKTPLTAAVETAANAMKIEETRATVILVTDGIETCDADPCAAGASLEARGLDFTAHVIGFGLSADEGRQVACLAEQTGGKYIEASNAGELADALSTVAEAVESGPPEAATATATITGPESVEIGSMFEVTWDGPGGKEDYVDLVPPGYTKTHGELSYGYTEDGNPVSMRAPGTPGDYELRYVWNAPQGRTVIANTTIKVVDAAVAIVAEPSIGIGQNVLVKWRGPNNDGDYVDLVPEGYTLTSGEKAYAYTKDGETLTLRAPGTPGAYALRYVAKASDGRTVLKTVPLEVTDTRVELAFNPAVAIGKALVVDWTGPGTKGDYVDIVPRGYKQTSGEKAYTYVTDVNPIEVKLPGEAGEYDVRYVLQSADGRTVLKTVPLTLKDIPFDVTPSKASVTVGETFSVAWAGPANQGDYVDIVPRGYKETSGEKSYTYVQAENPLSIQAPGEAGEYDLRYVLQSSTGRSVKAVAPLTLTAAKATLDIPASVQKGTSFDVSWTGPANQGDYVDLVPEGYTNTSGELTYGYTSEGPTITLEAPDKAGAYTVRYVLQARNGRTVITTKSISVK
ncbi:vWA domain-containing protein [Hyphomonas oceanitis]|uniref:von Willebrand factor A n=1 Tax=Hyphomonas oceanitis SCH89 TaxID=1280953 RepID=A0A059G978_9PROT|nr:VWA domain-containing protein [Hyphomonas oceanitis]KDA03145.1 von Willebrand factor A [Hyphomonas oceanitis SCH89]